MSFSTPLGRVAFLCDLLVLCYWQYSDVTTLVQLCVCVKDTIRKSKISFNGRLNEAVFPRTFKPKCFTTVSVWHLQLW